MSPRRRLLLQAVALVAGLLVVVTVLGRVLGSEDAPVLPADQAVPGAVLLVPGYGGSTDALEVLAF